MSTNDIRDDVKRRYDLADFMAAHGVQFGKMTGKTAMAFCPFHENTRTEALAIYGDHYHCFGCGAHGDIFDFAQWKYSETFKQVLDRLSNGAIERCELPKPNRAGRAKKQQEEYEHSPAFCSVCGYEPRDLDDFIAHTYEHGHEEWLSTWWASRGIHRSTMDDLKLGGYVNGRSWATIPITPPMDYDVQGYVGARKRSTQGKRAYRPWKPADDGRAVAVPYSIYTSPSPKLFFIVGGEIKAIRVAQALLDYDVCVLSPTTGEGQWKPEWAEYITGDVFIAADPDAAGAQFVQRVMESVGWYARVIHLPDAMVQAGLKIDDALNAGWDMAKALKLKRGL
jgi:hypothetical protein